jgi:hypothetical protein
MNLMVVGLRSNQKHERSVFSATLLPGSIVK